jgi:Kef-type K+ transport system membrane component KefB
MNPSALFLLQAFVIVALPVVLLRVTGLRGVMPLVVVQIFVGVALGPSVFGRLAPSYFQMFAGPSTLTPLTGLAILAVLIFGLITGLHVAPGAFSGDRKFWTLAMANVLVPMSLGCLAGYWILARYPGELLPGVNRAEFIAAIGIIVSMKALPVLGAIVGEMGLLGHRVGRLALAIAGVNDIILWILLSVLLAVVAAGHSGAAFGLPPVYLLVAAPVYLLFMVRVVRPVLGEMVAFRMHDKEVNTRAAVVVGAATIASALTTELMGLHYIIGAFLIGAVLPDNVRKPIADRLHVMTVALLMPFFFALTGMRTMIDLSSPALLEVFFVTAGVAIGGIIGGTAVTAALFRERWSFGFGLGSLLQAKGLTELIVLTVLLDARIVSPRIFAATVLMALFSTALAMPLARFALGRSSQGSLIMQPLTAPGQRV